MTLRSTPEGIRLFREPVREIELLHNRKHVWGDHLLRAGPDRHELFRRYGPTWRDRERELRTSLIPDTAWDLFDIRAEVELGDAKAFGAVIRGIDLRYDVTERMFSYLGRDIAAKPDGGRLRMQILVDRTSLELFVGEGRAAASFFFLPEPWDHPLEFYALEGGVRLVSLEVYELKSAWDGDIV